MAQVRAWERSPLVALTKAVSMVRALSQISSSADGAALRHLESLAFSGTITWLPQNLPYNFHWEFNVSPQINARFNPIISLQVSIYV